MFYTDKKMKLPGKNSKLVNKITLWIIDLNFIIVFNV